MPYTYRYYRWPSASDFLAAWAGAGLQLADGAPFVPGGDVTSVGPLGDPPGWHVNVAWPGPPPAALASAEVSWTEGLPAYAGSRGERPSAGELDTADRTFSPDPWQAALT